MIPLYKEHEFNVAKSTDSLKLQCEFCGSAFDKIKKEVVYELKHKRGYLKFCSKNCTGSHNKETSEYVNCCNCLVSFKKLPKEIKKTENHFCSRSCSATYNNKNKTHGNRRSKLEVWLEEQLNSQYLDLKIDYNQKDAIGSELDIYIPSLKLAFELNGIFHYEPIYGDKKLGQIKENDNNKFQKCVEHNISLCVIDVSTMINFKPNRAKKFHDIIVSIINQRTTR